jgi:hypothetical protein
MTTLITQQLAAANSASINVSSIRFGISKLFDQKATFRVTGGLLGVGEYVTLEYYDGTNWIVAEMSGNDGKILDENNSVRTVYGRMTNVRVSKSVTAAARGVEVV